MDIKEKLKKIEDVLDVESGSVSPDTILEDLEEWDSLAALSFVVMMQDDFNKKITGQVIRGFISVQDMIDIME